jgi:hypothetical protein
MKMGLTQSGFSDLANELNLLFNKDPAAAVARARDVAETAGRDGNALMPRHLRHKRGPSMAGGRPRTQAEGREVTRV